MDLKKFEKPKGKEKIKTTSLNLTESQVNFIRRNRLNLSALIRDFLEGLMAEEKINKGEK